jgi:hypothetical protein
MHGSQGVMMGMAPQRDRSGTSTYMSFQNNIPAIAPTTPYARGFQWLEPAVALPTSIWQSTTM